MNIIPGAEALSEFQGYFGDCGQTAELVALHIIRKLPLDGDHLNEIVRRDAAHQWADPKSGSEPLASIAKDLQLLGIARTQIPYQEPFPADWRTILRENAEHNPVIVQFAAAGNLPGDESGVRYHFITFVGGDGHGTYAAADGDNWQARSQRLVDYTEADIERARPCGMIVCFGAPREGTSRGDTSRGDTSRGGAAPENASPYTFLPDGTARDERTHQVLGKGFANYVRDHGVMAHCLLADTQYVPSQEFAAFDNGLILHWQAGEAISDTWGGHIALTLWQMASSQKDALAAAETALASQKAALDKANADLASARAALASANATIATMANGLPANPPSPTSPANPPAPPPPDGAPGLVGQIPS